MRVVPVVFGLDRAPDLDALAFEEREVAEAFAVRLRTVIGRWGLARQRVGKVGAQGGGAAPAQAEQPRQPAGLAILDGRQHALLRYRNKRCRIIGRGRLRFAGFPGARGRRSDTVCRTHA